VKRETVIDIFAEIEHAALNHWVWIVFVAIVLIQYFVLGHSVKKIASCLIGFLAFLIHHATSVFTRLAILLRSLADELEQSDREDKKKRMDLPS